VAEWLVTKAGDVAELDEIEERVRRAVTIHTTPS